MAEAVAAAATLVSIIGFSAQVFDGCVKGFVLLSTARNLGGDAAILRSMLEWEQLRLEQWAEKVSIHDPAKADMLVDWKLVTTTLQHIKDLTNDTEALQKKYNLILMEKAPKLNEKVAIEIDPENDEDKASTSRFKRLFGQSAKSSSAAARVIQSKSTSPKKLWWAAVDKQSLQNLINDISRFVQRLHDLLNLSMQTQMQQQIEGILEDAAHRYNDVPDLQVLREIAANARNEPPGYTDSHADEIAEEIDRKFRSQLFRSIDKGEVEEVESLLDNGVDLYAASPRGGYYPLVAAADAGQLEVVRMLLERGADPLRGTPGNRLPLHLAAEAGHTAVVELLLQQPTVDVNQKDYTGRTAFFWVVERSHCAVMEVLLRHPDIQPDAADSDNHTPLLQALFSPRKDVVKLLLDRPDVDVNHRDQRDQVPLWSASSKDEILQMVLKRKDVQVNLPGRYGETPLYHAVKWGGVRAVQLLLDAGADPNIGNEHGETPLGCAADMADEDKMDLLLAHPSIDINKADERGISPLLRAAACGYTKCVRILLAKGADITHADKNGKTALIHAATYGKKVAAKVLLKNKANINAQDGTGNTALACAAEKNHDAVVRFLLESGADASIADEDEETPFEKARDKRMEQIIAVFREGLRIHKGTQTDSF